MTGLTLLFLHGWGFDHRVWSPLRVKLAGVRTIAGDCGYFGQPVHARIDGPVVAVGHSLGAMLLLRDPPADCRALVAINGFDRFATPARVIDRMLARFAEEPRAVLDEFRRRIGAGPFAGPLDCPRLKEHLRLLRDLDCSERSAAFDRPILSLQADDDPLLPANTHDRLFATAPCLTRKSVATGGHLLPLTQPDWCAEQIRARLTELA